MSNELDKHFGQQLRGYESELDTEALWQAVRPPRRRRFGYWWLLLILCLVVGGTNYWLKHINKNEGEISYVDDYTTTSEISETARPQSSNQTTGNIVVTNTPEDESTNNVRSKIVPIPGISDTESGSDATINLTIERQADANTIVTNKPRQTVLSSTAIDPTLLKKDYGQSSDIPTEYTLAVGKDETSNPLHSLYNTQSVKQVTPALPLKQLGSDLLMPVKSINLLPVQQPTYLVEQPLSYNQTVNYPTYINKYKTTGFFLGLEGGFFATQRELNNNGDSLSTPEFLLNRQNTETVLDAWSTQLSVGYQHQRGWRIRTGLAFTQLTNLFEYTNTETQIDTIEGVQQIIISPNGDSTIINGRIARYQTTSTFKRTYNRIQQWEIPILIGYRIQKGPWGLVLEGGPRFLLQRKWSGDLLNDQNQIRDLEEVVTYRTNLGLQSIDAGAQILYRLNSKLDLSLGVWGRFSLQDYNTNDAPQQETYRLLGGQLGVFYRL